MVVGYMDSADRVFCPACWRVLEQVGKHPDRALQSVNPRDPNATFSVVNSCESCGHRVQYQDVWLLGWAPS
jgi:hypothetical protein